MVFFVLGTYVSFMGGNTTDDRPKSATGQFPCRLPSALACPVFVIGSFLETSLVNLDCVNPSPDFGVIPVLAGLVLNGHGCGCRRRNRATQPGMGMMNPALSKVGADRESHVRDWPR